MHDLVATREIFFGITDVPVHKCFLFRDAELPENLPKQKPKKNNKPSRSKKLKKGDDLFTPAPRPPPPLPPPVAVKPVKPKTPRITKTKRSFRGLSIFSDTNQVIGI